MRQKLWSEILPNWPLSTIFPGNFKVCLIFLERRRWKSGGVFSSAKYRTSPITAGGLEISLRLSFKSPLHLTHQKNKNLVAQLYSWEFEAKNDDETKGQDEEAIEIVIQEDKNGEVVKQKKKRKPPQIHDFDDEDFEENNIEVIRSKVKKKPLLS